MTSSGPICFGDVVKLYTKPDDEASCVGFLEHKSDQYLLVVPPVKEDAKSKYNEAEFIIAPIQCDKPPANGTPLHYKQPFVLKTSDHEGYSLNNKIKNAEQTIGLQPRDVKGEMYMVFEKDGCTVEAGVNDGDVDLAITVVDSNRIRKNYNKKLTFYTKNKSDALGGYISCGSKGKPLTFQIAKVAGATETKTFVQKQIPRRRSTVTMDAAKADEVGRAGRVGSDASDGDALSPPGSAAPTNPTAANVEFSGEKSVPESVPTDATTAESTPETTSIAVPEAVLELALPSPVAPLATPPPASAPAVELFLDVTLKEKAAETTAAASEGTKAVASSAKKTGVVEAAKPAVRVEATKTTGAKTPGAASLSTPVRSDPEPQPAKNKLAAGSDQAQQTQTQQPSSLTVTSEVEGAHEADEQIDSKCLGGGSCSIM